MLNSKGYRMSKSDISLLYFIHMNWKDLQCLVIFTYYPCLGYGNIINWLTYWMWVSFFHIYTNHSFMIKVTQYKKLQCRRITPSLSSLTSCVATAKYVWPCISQLCALFPCVLFCYVQRSERHSVKVYNSYKIRNNTKYTINNTK